jgi:hypothetical protein
VYEQFRQDQYAVGQIMRREAEKRREKKDMGIENKIKKSNGERN